MAFYNLPGASEVEQLARDFIIANPAMFHAYGDPDFLMPDGRLAWEWQAVIIQTDVQAFLATWNAGKNDKLGGLQHVNEISTDSAGVSEALIFDGGQWIARAPVLRTVMQGVTPNGNVGLLFSDEPIYTLQLGENLNDVIPLLQVAFKIEEIPGIWTEIVNSVLAELLITYHVFGVQVLASAELTKLGVPGRSKNYRVTSFYHG